MFLQSFIVYAQSIMMPAPAPAPGPSSDGKILDLGIAYVLMFGALAVGIDVREIQS
ncbi:hypothetical protein KP509_1Z067100 [Ceratopteris richardii]|nr:hypothetical protein KP509_1Z067100 [Ceratopteris richardii]